MLTKDPNRISEDTDYTTEEASMTRSIRQRNFKLIVAVLGIIVVGAMLIGSFSNNGDKANQASSPGLKQSNPVAAAMTSAAAATTVAAMTTAAATTAAAGADSAVGISNGANTASNTSSNPVPGSLPSDRMIIRNGNINIKVDNVQQTLGRITSIVNGKGGLIFSTSTDHRGDYTYATLTLQVPPAHFDETMSDIRSAAITVTNETSSSQDVTEEFVDNDAQVKNLSQTEQQLNTLLAKANSVTDVLAVQREITNVRGQIDRLEGRQKYLAAKTTMASITVGIEPMIAPIPEKVVTTTGWDFGHTLQNAWDGSVRGLQGLVTALITIGVYLWVLPLLLLSFWLLIKLYRATQNGWNGPNNNKQPPATPTI